MPIFRDTVAQEACPAKTAESISYVATFAVLGWLLVSNYSSSVGNSGQDFQPLASSTTAPLDTVTLLAPTLTTAKIASLSSPQTEADSDNFIVSAPVWHAALEQFPQLESQTYHRVFSPAGWASQSDEINRLQIGGEIDALPLSLSLVDVEYLLSSQADFVLNTSDELTQNALAEAKPIQEITVTGTETNRLSRRPDNTQRPQIPRPYRAQDIQRSLVLPPRIQALRP